MTNWRQSGWCDRCEVTLDNGAADDGVCPLCGFDSNRADAERRAERRAEQDAAKPPA